MELSNAEPATSTNPLYDFKVWFNWLKNGKETSIKDMQSWEKPSKVYGVLKMCIGLRKWA